MRHEQARLARRAPCGAIVHGVDATSSCGVRRPHSAWLVQQHRGSLSDTRTHVTLSSTR
jgi:hypothetical protein